MDSLFGFTEALGIDERSMRWDIPLDQASLDVCGAQLIPDPASRR